MEFVEPLEQYLDSFISILKLLLEAIAAICVLIGLIRTGQLAVATPRRVVNNIPFREASFEKLPIIRRR